MSGEAKRSRVQTVVEPFRRRVVRYKRDQVGNDLTAVLRWCSTHHEPVWEFGDGSSECPRTLADPDEHVITDGPWEMS